MLRRKSNSHLSSLNFVYKDLKMISKPIPCNKHKHALKRAKKVSLGISIVTKILSHLSVAGFSGLWISNYLRCAVPFMTHFYIWSIITYNHLQINQSQLAIRGCFQYRAQRNCLWMSQRTYTNVNKSWFSLLLCSTKGTFLADCKEGRTFMMCHSASEFANRKENKCN